MNFVLYETEKSSHVFYSNCYKMFPIYIYMLCRYLKSYLIKFSDWIHNYIICHDSVTDFQFDFKQHCVFYSICQAMFYLIAFRHQDLVNSSVSE